MKSEKPEAYCHADNPIKICLSDRKITLISFLLILPFFLFFDLFFRLLWRVSILSALSDFSIGLFLLLIPLGIILHEVLHGATWALFAMNGFRSIQFGFQWEFLMPYCTCSDIIAIRHFRLGVIIPFLLLGIAPFIYSLFVGNSLLGFIAFFFAVASGSDLQVLWLLAGEKKTTRVLDHPTKPGFFLYRE